MVYSFAISDAKFKEENLSTITYKNIFICKHEQVAKTFLGL